jgi:hypothetical protein
LLLDSSDAGCRALTEDTRFFLSAKEKAWLNRRGMRNGRPLRKLLTAMVQVLCSWSGQPTKRAGSEEGALTSQKGLYDRLITLSSRRASDHRPWRTCLDVQGVVVSELDLVNSSRRAHGSRLTTLSPENHLSGFVFEAVRYPEPQGHFSQLDPIHCRRAAETFFDA